MKTQTNILILVVIAMVLLFAGQSQAQNLERYIVTIQGPVQDAVRAAGGQIIHEYTIIPGISESVRVVKVVRLNSSFFLPRVF